MAIDPWLPVGFALPGGSRTRVVQFEGPDWQMYETVPDGAALVVKETLGRRWLDGGILEAGTLASVSFGPEAFQVLLSGPNHRLAPVEVCPAPRATSEARSFAVSLAETRRYEPSASLHDAIYAERFSRLLPIWSLSQLVDDDLVLGAFLSGGMRVSALSERRLESLVRGFSGKDLNEVVKAAGLRVRGTRAGAEGEHGRPPGANATSDAPGPKGARQFRLPGRAHLEHFFTEHVIDIIDNAERYRSLGIDFPSAIALYGPPGGGKTFAVERLVEYLAWPSFSIDSNTIGSPYIHETGRKIARMFDEAIRAAPSVLVIDEMEAFLSDRQAAGESGHHRVEEVAEFLRRIPEALKSRVLVMGMTNRIEMIDPAILRRGRFDHVIEVGMPTSQEVRALLGRLLADVPRDTDVDVESLVAALTGRALSDAAFVVRESARLAARSGRTSIDRKNLLAALESLPPRQTPGVGPRPIGFR